MKAGIYLRQSLDVAEGIERQRERCRALVQARGWDLAGEYVDNDTSASKKRGEGTAWATMLDDAVRDRLDVVVAVDVDRLLRNVSDLVSLTESGAKVLTVDGEIDLTTADGEFRATMLAGIARFEVRRKSERQVRANEARARQGKRVGGRRPFGYEADGVTVRESEAEAIRAGYAAILAGETISSVVRMWNSQGFTTGQTRQARSGHAGEPSPWQRSTVRRVLLNQRNAGRLVYKGEVQATPAEWPAIIDEATFEGVRAILTNPSRVHRGRGAVALLTGYAVCGVCGATVHSGGSVRAGRRGYRCTKSMGHFARLAEPVEDFVESVAVERLSRDDARVLLVRAETVATEDLHAELVGLRERLELVAVEFADGVLTAGQLRAATQRIQARIVELEGRLSDASRVDALGDLVGAADVGEAWGRLSTERKREALRALMRVTLYPPGRGVRTFRPESVGIEWVSVGS